MTDYQAKAIQVQDIVLAAAANGFVDILKEVFVPNILPGLENREAFFSDLAYKGLDIATQNNQTATVEFFKDQIRSLKLGALVMKADKVMHAQSFGGDAEKKLAELTSSAQEAALVTELIAGTREVMHSFNKHAKKFTNSHSAHVDREIALSYIKEKRRQKPSEEQKAILKQYGFQSEGLMTTILSRGFNKRANALLLPQVEKQEREILEKIYADYSAATDRYYKDLNAVYSRVKKKLSV